MFSVECFIAESLNKTEDVTPLPNEPQELSSEPSFAKYGWMIGFVMILGSMLAALFTYYGKAKLLQVNKEY